MTELPAYATALREALTGVAALGRQETVPLEEALGRVLAANVRADRDLPSFNRAQMDGYALRAAEVGRIDAWPVVARIAAGQPADVDVAPGTCVAIATGAPLPAALDTVIQHEHSDRRDPVRFTVQSIDPGHAVHRCGADARQGSVLIASPTVLAAHHIGIAAAVGAHHLQVAARPRVTVLTSGDEVKPIEHPVAAHQIRNSNGLMLAALFGRVGAELIAHEHVADDRAATIDAVGAALARSDMLVTVGGVSAGERDFFPDAFEANAVTTRLRGAAIQPGRPILVGAGPAGQVVLALPGNPVSALACACLFGWPLVRTLLGLPADLPWREAKLADPVKANPRRQAFRPAQLTEDGIVRVPRWAGSGDLAHTAATDGLAALPVQVEPVHAGTTLRFLPWP